jgi:hypothetical protein
LYLYADVFALNTQEAFLEWLATTEYRGEAESFKEQAERVFPRFTSNWTIGTQLDLSKFNGLSTFLFQHEKYRFHMEATIPLTTEEEALVNNIIDNTTHLATSFVQPEDSGSDCVAGFSDLEIDIFGEEPI